MGIVVRPGNHTCFPRNTSASTGVREGWVPTGVLHLVTWSRQVEGKTQPVEEAGKHLLQALQDDGLISGWALFRYLMIGLYVGLAMVGVFIYWFPEIAYRHFLIPSCPFFPQISQNTPNLKSEDLPLTFGPSSVSQVHGRPRTGPHPGFVGSAHELGCLFLLGAQLFSSVLDEEWLENVRGQIQLFNIFHDRK